MANATSPTSALSVTSSSRRCGDRPVSARMERTRPGRFGSRRWTGDRLQASMISSDHAAAARQARRISRSVSGPIRPSSLGERNELGRRDHAPGGMGPPRQHFEADACPGPQRHERLEIGLDRVGRDGPSQLALEQGERAHLRVAVPLEHAEAAAPVGLGAIEGRIRAMDQVVDVARARARERDPDAGPDLDHDAAVEVEGMSQRRDDAGREFAGLAARLVVVGRPGDPGPDRELVAAEPRHGGVRADRFAETRRHALQQPVAGRMTVGVVGGLEPVRDRSGSKARRNPGASRATRAASRTS